MGNAVSNTIETNTFCTVTFYEYMCNNEIFKTIKIYLDPCSEFGGIPNSNENACCDASCGICGGVGCSDRYDRYGMNCCVRQIPEQQICGDWQDPPCLLEY